MHSLADLTLITQRRSLSAPTSVSHSYLLRTYPTLTPTQPLPHPTQTIRRVQSSGDQITKISGHFSGSLSFVISGVEEGRLFSELVREAREKGLTEPDPRDDLSGRDTARKARTYPPLSTPTHPYPYPTPPLPHPYSTPTHPPGAHSRPLARVPPGAVRPERGVARPAELRGTHYSHSHSLSIPLITHV